MVWQKLVVLRFLVLILLIPSSVFGQDFNKDASPLEVSLSLEANDNFNPLTVDEVSALGYQVGAKGSLVNHSEGIWFQADYAASGTSYNLDNQPNLPAMDESFNDYDLGIKTRLFISPKWFFDVGIKQNQYDEKFATGLSRSRKNIRNADRVTLTNISSAMTYGSDTDSRYITLSVENAKTNYDPINEYSDLFDLSQDIVKLEVGFSISQVTKLLASMEYRDLDYTISDNLDSQILRALAGISWQPAGKSRLHLLVGYYQHRFDNIDNNNGLTWELGADYFPRDDFSISLDSSRRSTAGDSETATDTVVVTTQSRMTYRYSERWWIGANLMARSIDYEEPTGARTADDFTTGAFLQLRFRDYHSLTLSVDNQSVEDADRAIDYQQNRIDLIWQYAF